MNKTRANKAVKQTDRESGSSIEEDSNADSESESSDSQVAGSRKTKRAYSVGK